MTFSLLAAITIVLAIISQQYCIRRVIKTIKQLFPNLYGRKTKIGISVFLVIFNVYFILFILFWLRITFAAGDDSILQNTTFDFLVAYPAFMIFLMMLQIGLFLLLFDLIKLVLLPLYSNNRERWKSLEAKAVLVLVVFFMIYVPARIIYDYNVFPVSTIEYKKQSLPMGMENFKITFISDIHNKQCRMYNLQCTMGNPEKGEWKRDGVTGGRGDKEKGEWRTETGGQGEVGNI